MTPQTARPRSAVRPLTTYAGMAMSVASLWLVLPYAPLDYQKSVLLALFVAVPMILLDLFVFRVDRNDSSGLAPGFVNALHPHRLLRKLVGLAACMGTIGLAYWAFPEYAGDFYDPFWAALRWVLPLFLPATLIYVVYVDLRQQEPEDVYARLGAMLLGGAAPPAGLGTLARTWAVKGFFLPLMFVYLTQDMGFATAAITNGAPRGFMAWYDLLYRLIFTFDVLFTIIGYTLTVRLLDAHVRSAEPTMFGWTVCLICYQPFWSLIFNQYIRYDDPLYWGSALEGLPALQVVWGCAILACVIVYVWATFCFGLRFSNLTARGVITHGPYRLSKHPAYVAKNLSWWLISVPFIPSGDWSQALKHCVLLGLLNLVYVLRAITEERHLAQVEPAYPAYQAWMRDHGLFAPLARLVRQGR